MVIFMSGLPYSGKSYVVDLLSRHLDNPVIISPKDLRTDDYSSSNDEHKRCIDIAAWKVSLDLLYQSMKDKGSLIIYDTACASANVMQKVFSDAKLMGHKVLYVFVNTDIDICKNRANGAWSDKLDRYNDSFSVSIPILKKIATKMVIINNNDKPDIDKLLSVINL
jgi:predicted kinase